MIRCHAQQVTLHNSSTCDARLAWLNKFEAKTRATMNSLGYNSERTRAEEYQRCRVCRGLAKTAVLKKPAPKPKKAGVVRGTRFNRLPKAVLKCEVCQEVKTTYAKGRCKECYWKEYNLKRKGCSK